MKRIRIAAVAFAIAILASMLLARAHPFGDAGLYAGTGSRPPIMEHSTVPPDVRVILIAKCADCHSAQTHAPLYGRFAPMTWVMERDVIEARRALNLSLWNTYAADRQQILAAKIVQETKSHEMPLLQYRMIHWNARITDADLNAFTQWARSLAAGDPASTSQLAGEGDPVRGKDVFERRCTGCHTLTQNREGPQLRGVYGRTSGELPNFAYSPALKKAHVFWNETTLERWLTDPDAFVRGNDMNFRVAKPQERRDLISFLRREAGR